MTEVTRKVPVTKAPEKKAPEKKAPAKKAPAKKAPAKQTVAKPAPATNAPAATKAVPAKAVAPKVVPVKKVAAAVATRPTTISASVTQPVPTPTAKAPSPASPRRTGLRARLADLLLTVGAIAGVLCVLVAVAAYAFQVHLVVFRTGSMSPAIETGALAVSRTVPASDLAIGDVVTVRSATGQRITHRVQDLLRTDDGARLTLRGDANSVDDAQPYDVTEADRVIASVPRAGYVVAWLSGPIGIFGGGLLVGLTLLIAFGRGTAPAPDGTPRGVSGVTAAALVLGLGVSMATVVTHRDTLASWTNAAAATTGTLATGSYGLPAAPRITTCTKANGGQGNTIAWTAATNPTTFEVRYTGNTHSAQSIAGTLRTVQLVEGLNAETGTFYLVAITSAGTSPASNLVSYSGNGSGKVCTVG